MMLAAAWAWLKGSKIAMWAGVALTALLTVLGILARERAKGREQERSKQDQKALETTRTADAVEQKVDALPPAEQKEKLKGWARD